MTVIEVMMTACVTVITTLVIIIVIMFCNKKLTHNWQVILRPITGRMKVEKRD